MSEVFQEVKQKIQYNLAQLLFFLAYQKFVILEWARGTGKSTILAKRIIDCVHQMPRSSGVLPAATYMQIKTRTLPSTIKGLEDHGYFKGIHYFVGERPPSKWGWPEPYEPPLDYKNSMIWHNGTVVNFVSQDGGGTSGRGMNNDWGICDEMALIKETWFMTDILATIRGGLEKWAIYPDGTRKKFRDCSLHHSFLGATSTPVTIDGRWVLKYEELAHKEPEKYGFLMASAEVNRINLGEDYFINAKNSMLPMLYNAEILNIRMGKIVDGFYPLLNEAAHCYTNYHKEYYNNLPYGGEATCLGDADLDMSLPLIIGVDWGARINCLVAAQADANNLYILKNLFVKYPQIIDDLVMKFMRYYEPKKAHNNVIHMFYDPTGNTAQANSRITNAELVKKILNNNGWDCRLLTRGMYNVPHEQKYTLWNELLKGTRFDLPKVQFNKPNCMELWISMTNAPARAGSTEAIKKDKRSETSNTLLQEHATHLSDAVDVIVVGMYINRVSAPAPLPPPEIR